MIFLRLFLGLILWQAGLASMAQAAEKKLPRIVSLNMCADPYLMAFAPDQIIALTHLSQDPTLSVFHEQAAHYPSTDGRIEAILQLQPDIVIISPYSDSLRRDILKAHNIDVLVLAASTHYSDSREEIMKLGHAIGRTPEAAAYLQKLDANMTRLKTRAFNVHLLNLQRRGITAGAGHILDDIITHAGAKNAASYSDQSLNYIRLEHIFILKPDFLLLGTDDTGGKGNDILIHPSLTKAYPPTKRIHLPEKFSICAGATTPLAVEALQNALQQKYTDNRPRYK